VGAEIGMRCSLICTASVSTRRHFQMGPAKKFSGNFFERAVSRNYSLHRRQMGRQTVRGAPR
jgi:hypothetical protein